mmetsp:Transcript_3727/g.13752  ORF Transcript_3727/g.13752 Transcript_3727/m.13752 type:complete len:408 (+) Transcript_3727:3137-4360(+)
MGVSTVSPSESLSAAGDGGREGSSASAIVCGLCGTARQPGPGGSPGSVNQKRVMESWPATVWSSSRPMSPPIMWTRRRASGRPSPEPLLATRMSCDCAKSSNNSSADWPCSPGPVSSTANNTSTWSLHVPPASSNSTASIGTYTEPASFRSDSPPPAASLGVSNGVSPNRCNAGDSNPSSPIPAAAAPRGRRRRTATRTVIVPLSHTLTALDTPLARICLTRCASTHTDGSAVVAGAPPISVDGSTSTSRVTDDASWNARATLKAMLTTSSGSRCTRSRPAASFCASRPSEHRIRRLEMPAARMRTSSWSTARAPVVAADIAVLTALIVLAARLLRCVMLRPPAATRADGDPCLPSPRSNGSNAMDATETSVGIELSARPERADRPPLPPWDASSCSCHFSTTACRP